MIPGVLYGKATENKNISVEPEEVVKILTSESGQNTIFKMKVGKEKVDVLIKEYMLDPVKGNLIHADFMAVNLDDVMVFQVPVHAVGESDGVKNFGGILDIIHREIEVECKASAVPEHIDIDVTSLGLHDQIRVRDIAVPEKIKILTDPDQVVLSIAPPAVEVEGAEGESLEGESAEPEVLKKGKAEEAEEE